MLALLLLPMLLLLGRPSPSTPTPSARPPLVASLIATSSETPSVCQTVLARHQQDVARIPGLTAVCGDPGGDDVAGRYRVMEKQIVLDDDGNLGDEVFAEHVMAHELQHAWDWYRQLNSLGMGVETFAETTAQCTDPMPGLLMYGVGDPTREQCKVLSDRGALAPFTRSALADYMG